MQGRCLGTVVLLLACLLPACDERPAPAPVALPGPAAEASTLFDPDTTGSITGRVAWKGPIPCPEALRAVAEPLTDLSGGPAHDWPNPNAPRIDPGTRGVASAVVFLRGIDVRRARPWDHPPVSVETTGWQFHVRQGSADRLTGLVRAGDSVEIVSGQQEGCTVQARGSAFFALAQTERGQSRSRRLVSPGVVELQSGTGQFWMRAYLFVARHPYLAHPDAKGNFRFDRVPPGEYDLVAWHPDWRIEERQRNPELFRVQQVRFRPAFEVIRRARVRPGQVEAYELFLTP